MWEVTLGFILQCFGQQVRNAPLNHLPIRQLKIVFNILQKLKLLS